MTDPIPMFLTCPGCGARHIDKGEFATRPHHTHACQTCGLTWRPAVVSTVGVQFLPGFKDDGGSAVVENEKVPSDAGPADLVACQRCDGCGKVANSEEGGPWSAWASLPLLRRNGSRRKACPSCGETGHDGKAVTHG